MSPLVRKALCLSFLVSAFFISAAQEKGLSPAEKSFQSSGRTRALVVGISRYEHIDTLSYAHRDAEVFADFLKRHPSWKLKPGDITLLTNETAKRGTVLTELQRLAVLSQPGDNLVFYFSGHGDVETITMFNKGYLLAYDTYSNNYLAGAIPVNDLRDIFMTLTSNNVKVIVITDACRSGKLAGGTKGIEYTATSLKTIWSNEIKILSSQPGQLSQEGPQWGGGRGVFSYYLVNGLEGAADNNHDSLITLAELESYVGNIVSNSTRNDQQPIIDGPNKYSTIIANLRQSLSPSPSPGRKTATLNRADSCELYETRINEAILGKRFDPTDSESAISLYRKLKSCTADRDLLISANARLLGALMNETQEIVNRSFIGNSLVSPEEIAKGQSWLSQVMELNDIKLTNTAHLVNLQRYLRVIGTANWGTREQCLLLDKTIDSAIRQEPDAAYLLMAKGALESRKGNRGTSIKVLEDAVRKSPQWLMPKYYLGVSYGQNKNYEKALGYFEEVLKKDSSMRTFECVKCILVRMTEFAFKLKHVDRALAYFELSTQLFPDYFDPYGTLYDYAIELKDTRIAERLISKSNEFPDSVEIRLYRIRFESEFYGTPIPRESLDSVKLLLKTDADRADYAYTLGNLLLDGEDADLDSAYSLFYEAIRLDPQELAYLESLISVLHEWHSYEEVVELINEHLDTYEGDEKALLRYYLLEAYLMTDEPEKALAVAKEMLQSGHYDCSDLKKMKKVFKSLKEYDELIRNCD